MGVDTPVKVGNAPCGIGEHDPEQSVFRSVQEGISPFRRHEGVILAIERIKLQIMCGRCDAVTGNRTIRDAIAIIGKTHLPGASLSAEKSHTDPMIACILYPIAH